MNELLKALYENFYEKHPAAQLKAKIASLRSGNATEFPDEVRAEPAALATA